MMLTPSDVFLMSEMSSLGAPNAWATAARVLSISAMAKAVSPAVS